MRVTRRNAKRSLSEGRLSPALMMEHKVRSPPASSVSSKRKTSKPRQKGKTQGASKDLETECKSSQNKPSKSEDTPSQKVQKIKISLGGKKSQGFQSGFVPEEPPEDSVSESPCSSITSSSQANGTDDTAQPLRKSASWLETKRGKHCTEPEKEKGTVPRKRQKAGGEANKGPDQNLSKESKHSGQKQKNQSLVEKQDQKTKGQGIKKDSPSYPPGSQEERWHLQILDKGRVTCPKCKAVVRKTVEGLKKHMTNCKMNPFTCQHCGKQLKSLTGMKYHVMADHNNLPTSDDANGLDNHSLKDRLRKVLKRMGKLKCTKEGCTGSFTSIMGYLYHMRKCGKEESELEKLVLNCKHCGKPYKSKAGLEYHLKSEHGPTPLNSEEEDVKAQREPNPERTACGRVKRRSAQVAVFHLQEIASEELLKEWPKRKVQQDLVPDDRKLKYARPGLPAFSQEVLRKWKNEVKLHRKVHCPNEGCNSVYTSVSGLKAHLGLCSRGDFEAGKYKCLICDKEFSSESGVKYHINSIHAQDWFVVSSKTKSFEKMLKTKPKEDKRQAPPEKKPSLRFTTAQKRRQEKKPVPSSSAGLRMRREALQKKKKQKEKEKDCYDFSGSDSRSSSSSCGSSSSSSSSDSEQEEQEAPRQDKWALKRPVARSGAGQRAK